MGCNTSALTMIVLGMLVFRFGNSLKGQTSCSFRYPNFVAFWKVQIFWSLTQSEDMDSLFEVDASSPTHGRFHIWNPCLAGLLRKLKALGSCGC